VSLAERLTADPAARARALRWTFGVIVALLLFNLVFGDMGVIQGIRQRHAVSILRGELREAETENASLEAEVKALGTDPFRIETIAREELGLARPGEIIFLFPTSKDGVNNAAAPSAPRAAAPAPAAPGADAPDATKAGTSKTGAAKPGATASGAKKPR
jgi:cell division protein FtsB